MPDLSEIEHAPFHVEYGDVVRICSMVEGRPHIIVGGQALNFWAEHYAGTVEALASYGPFTSKDVDFFGRADLGYFLADRLGGEVTVPGPDDGTPSAAVVIARLDGRRAVVIDVLSSILGVDSGDLVRGQIKLEMPFELDGNARAVRLVLMHPLHCFVSRAAAVYHPATRRCDVFALRQLRAAP